MPIVTRESISGFKTCGRNLRKLGYCKGYVSAPAELIRETVERTHRELGGDDDRVSVGFEYLHPARLGTDNVCDVCGGPVSLSLEARPEYERGVGLSWQETVRRDAEERERDRSMLTAGVPMRTLQECMGHRDIATTQRYADYAPSGHEAELVAAAFAQPRRAAVKKDIDGSAVG
jgi:hypothetical protein